MLARLPILTAILLYTPIGTACSQEVPGDDSMKADEANRFTLALRGEYIMSTAADVAALPGKNVVAVSNWHDNKVTLVDVSNPEQPQLIREIEDTPNTTDVQVKGDFLYVNGDPGFDIGEETYGIRVYDVSDPANPSEPYLVGKAAGSQSLSSCHNLWPQPDRALLYCASTSTEQVAILSEGENGVGAPGRPEFLTEIQSPNDTPDGGFGGVHDMFARGDRLYVAWLGAGFAIYDISDPAAPKKLGGAITDGEFTHTVWPTEDDNYVLATDETRRGHLTIWDVREPSDIKKVADYDPNSEAIVHNAEVVGDIAYVSYYTEGLKVLDISDPTNPREIGTHDLFDGPDYVENGDPFDSVSSSMQGAWGVDSDYPWVYVSTIEGGLYIFELSAGGAQ